MHSLNGRLARLMGLPLLVVVLHLLPVSDAHAQRAGQSTTIRAGTVMGMQAVDLRSGNTAAGAVTGGALGAVLSRNSSSSKRNRNAAIGAVLGGAAAKSKTKRGTKYTVALNDGTMIEVATEQTAIAVGDCVFVEERQKRTNIRRAPATACEPESEAILKDADVAAELQQDAASCFAARQELAEAEDDATFDRAVRKIKLLCYD